MLLTGVAQLTLIIRGNSTIRLLEINPPNWYRAHYFIF